MVELQRAASRLLRDGKVNLVIGYALNREGRVRAEFAQKADQTEQLVLTRECRQNLAVYLTKTGIRGLGRAAIVALPSTCRSIIQLFAESQLREREVVVLVPDKDNGIREIESPDLLREFTGDESQELDPEDRQILEQLREMSADDRWRFWTERFSRCFKCYACRAACPLCYCARCTSEVNQPQWIPAPSHHLGNLEWHVMRAMHLAGRCVGCGECGRACPMGIPVHLLSLELNREIFELYGTRAGGTLNNENALAVFKPDDPGNFIR